MPAPVPIRYRGDRRDPERDERAQSTDDDGGLQVFTHRTRRSGENLFDPELHRDHASDALV